MWALVIAGAMAVLVVWYLVSRSRRGPKSPLLPGEQAIDIRVPNVPPDLERRIAGALRNGADPDEIELPGGWHAHHQRIVGESFNNPNGSSRQELIASAQIGTAVFLVPEPDNPHDTEAVRVFLDKGGGATALIGYLPRDAGALKDEVSRGHVAAWLASVRRAGDGKWGAALYVLRIEP